MTYKTGSISGTAAANLCALIAADAVALGYVQVQSAYVEGIYTWRVLRSPGTLNTEGVDWYLYLGFLTSGQGTLIACCSEDWNDSTKQVIRFPPNTSNLTPGANFENPQAAVALPSTGTTVFNRTATIANGDSYWYSITLDRLAVFATQSTTTTVRMSWYLGLYDRFLVPADDPCPLVFCSIAGQNINTNNANVSGSAAAGSASREPRQSAADSANFFAGIYSGGSAIPCHVWNAVASQGSTTTLSVEGYSGLPMVSRLCLWGRDGSNPSGPAVMPRFLRGLLKGMWWAVSPTTNTPGSELQWTFGGQPFAAVKMRSGPAAADCIYLSKE